MALSIPVIIRHVQDLSSARYAAGMQVDYIAFDRSSPSGIEAAKFEAIKGWLSGSSIGIEIEGMNQYNAITQGVDFVIFTEEYHQELVIDKLTFFLVSLVDMPEVLPPIGANLILQLEAEEAELHSTLLMDLCMHYNVWLELSTTSSDPTIYIQLCKTYAYKGICMVAKPESEVGMAEVDHIATVLEQLEMDT